MAFPPRDASPFASLFAKNRAGKGKADEAPGDDDDMQDDEDETDEAKKARKAKKAKKAKEDNEQDEKDEQDPEASAARGRERARIEAILLCPGAQRGGGMATAAVHMAINTSTPRGTAMRTLAGMAGIPAATAGASRSRLRAPDRPTEALQQPHGADLATAIVRAGEARRGERFFGSIPKPAAPREAMTAAGIVAAAAAARGEEAPEMIAGPVQNGHVTTGAEMLAVMRKHRGEP